MPRMGDTAAQDAYDVQYAPYGVGSPAESADAPSGMGAIASSAYNYLGDLAKRAFGASETMRTEGTYNPAPVMEAAMLPMTGAVAGTGPGGFAVGSGPIKAYHSSPHDFDKFDLAKIGTGEGAQVYGHGLYFAENPAVSGQGGQYWNQFARRFMGPDQPREVVHAMHILEKEGGNRAAALANIDKVLRDKVKTAYSPESMEATRALLASDKPVGPRTYEVNINADPAHMLDWDKPLREQAHLLDQLQSAGVSRSLLNEASGGDLYHKAAIDFHRPGLGHLDRALASEKFAEAGIPGIKYLDQGSRNAAPIIKADKHGNIISSEYPPPSSNYVIFNPSIIDIMKKYGIAGAAPAGMGALAAQDAYRGE